MDTLTLLMFMMLVVLVVIVIQLRRASREGGTCNCPVDQNWLDGYNQWHADFGKWVMAQEKWDEEVYNWMVWARKVIERQHSEDPDVGEGDPPSPPCKFGSC
jgi:hypothetical protein